MKNPIVRKKNPNSRSTRIRRIIWNRMFPHRQDALQVAFSVAIGVFIGVAPTLGVALILTVVVCAAFKLPKVPGVVASFVANPVTQFGFFYPVGYMIGKKFIDVEKINFDFLEQIEGLSFKNFIQVITNLLDNASGHLLAFMVGIMILAFVFALIFFILAYFVVSYRKNKRIKVKNSYIRSLITEDQELIREAKQKGKTFHMHIYPFKALRPVIKENAKDISALPYDVMNRREAAEMAKDLPHSYLRVTRSEIEFEENVDPYSSDVYLRAKENLDKMIQEGVIAHEEKDSLYVYRQTMEGREQYGLVCCVPAKDYFHKIIKKHELTRADKEEDRLRHILATNANTGPVFLTYRDQGQFDLYGVVRSREPLYDFVTEADGFGHTVWKIDDDSEIEAIVKSFNEVPVSYIADGHHRSAAGARASGFRAENNPNNTGEEEYNRFLTILFPSTQLKIMDYNRVLKTWNGHSPDTLLQALDSVFHISKIDSMASPSKQNQVHLYLDAQWYLCEFKDKHLKNLSPVNSLDVDLLQKLVLEPVFGIKDPRTSHDIDFVGGIRGLEELEKRVDSKECSCAFAMHPTTIDQLMEIADAGEIMPPKSTWFEPKLRDGLLVHTLDD